VSVPPPALQSTIELVHELAPDLGLALVLVLVR
jgi:hypothetical protein